ncbi:cytoskeletal protein RodZ [Sporosarcina luteola]|nr:cytoskeletal protein RodZ [Sporosarcina luteola]
MANNNWNDDKIEKLLHSMPKIDDHRSPDEILARIKKDERLKKTNTKKRHVRRWAPAIIAVAALLVVSLLIPSFFRGNEKASESDSAQLEQEQENFSHKRSMDMPGENEQSEAATANKLDQSDALYTIASAMESHLILPDEADGQYPFHIGLVHSANVIPITILVSKERVEQDMVVKAPNSVDLYNQYAAQVPEGDLGFDDYHPYKGKLYSSGETVINEVPDGHGYDLAGTQLYVYYNSAKETFLDHKFLQVMDETGKPAELDQVGTATPESLERKLPYFKYRMPSGKVYLIPYENGDTDNVSDALVAMKAPQNEIVESVVPAHLDYDVSMIKDIAVVTFSEKINLDLMDPVEVNEMIEGFMLTGSSFDTQIQMKNIEQTHFGKYELSEPLPIPIGANPMFLPE